MTLPRRLLDSWVNYPLVDYPVVLAVGAAIYFVDPTLGLRSQDHGSFHQTLAAVSGILLTLGAIVITLVFTVTPNDRLEWVMRNVGLGLQRLVMRCLGGLVLTTAGFAALFIYDQGVDPRQRIAVTCMLVTLGAFRFARLWWLLSRVLEALTTRPPGKPADVDQWQRPAVTAENYRVRRRMSKIKRTG